MGDGSSRSDRLLAWAYTDIWSSEEVSATRRLTSWIALILTVLLVLMVGMGH